MGYRLGIDLGTTFTAAAVYRDGRVEIASLGNRAASIPSVVFLREDGTVLVGEAGERRAVTEPERVAREFKRRIGDTTPLLLGGTPYSAEALMAKLMGWVVDAVTEVQGEVPDHIGVTHPANWGPYKTDLLQQAARMTDLDQVTLLTEPEAAAIHYASNERIEDGTVVAVYDLGGGTFDAAVLQKAGMGFRILGAPEGIERLGGIDFDHSVLAHVSKAIDGALDELDPTDPRDVAAVDRLRHDCVEAKEALSTDTDASIPVMLPSLQTQVRLTRAEFEGMVRPILTETISALRRALRSADVESADVSKVLLVGGSSRIPLVAQMVSAEFGRPVAVDAHPKYAIAHGAALAAEGFHRERTGALNVAQVKEAASELLPSVQQAPVPASGDGTPVGNAHSGDDRAVASSVGFATSDRTAMHATPVEQPTRSGPQRSAAIDADDPAVQSVPPGTHSTTWHREAALPQDPSTRSRDEPAPPPDEATPPLPPEPPLPPAPPPPKRKWWLVLSAVAVLIAVTGFGAYRILSGIGNEPDALTTPSPDVVPTAPPGSQFFSRITAIGVEGTQYVVHFETLGFDALLEGENKHVHFFFDTVPASQAGVPGQGPWKLHPAQPGVIGESPFVMFGVADVPPGATQMCILVANSDHSVIPETGNCMPLP